ncbi:MAG: hypothetical protein QJR02_01470 [Sinobacteraceae bacterium]|nr:hypothetical protein [Nevskiaceae bacterium]
MLTIQHLHVDVPRLIVSAAMGADRDGCRVFELDHGGLAFHAFAADQLRELRHAGDDAPRPRLRDELGAFAGILVDDPRRVLEVERFDHHRLVPLGDVAGDAAIERAPPLERPLPHMGLGLQELAIRRGPCREFRKRVGNVTAQRARQPVQAARRDVLRRQRPYRAEFIGDRIVRTVREQRDVREFGHGLRFDRGVDVVSHRVAS